MTRLRLRGRTAAILLLLLFLAAGAGSLQHGTTGWYGFARTWHAILALVGLATPESVTVQNIVELRLGQTLVAAGVGAALAYSGALLQGLFRNALASPSVLGVTSGAILGASIAILIAGGYWQAFLLERLSGVTPLLVTLFAFAGALAVSLAVAAIASHGGHLSVPTLLLSGIAMNVFLGGVLATIQSLVLADDVELAKALYSWSFGELKDHSPMRIALVLGGTILAALAIPFLGRELDLFAGGEEDAESLGVDTSRVKLLALVASSLATACAVAVAGQIAFVGLVVPHLLRLVVGPSHRSILPLSLLGGATFLLGTDFVQRVLLGRHAFPPGILMSLIGGPLFLVLLLRGRREMQTW
jgi:iron complex transport system permease protein